MKKKTTLSVLLVLVILLLFGYFFIIPEVKAYFYNQQEESYIKDKIVEIAPKQTVLFDSKKEDAEPYGTGAYLGFKGSVEFTLNSIEVFDNANKYFAYPPSQIHPIQEDHDPSKYNYVELSCTVRNIDAQTGHEDGEDIFDAFLPNCLVEYPGGNPSMDSVFFDSSEVQNPEEKAWQCIQIPQRTEKTYKIGYLIDKEHDLNHVMLSYGTSSHYKYRTYPAKYSNLPK